MISESFERIHRSNLVGMGVLPLQFPAGETADSLGLTGEETFDITGFAEALNGGELPKTTKVVATNADGNVTEFDAVRPHRHPQGGGLLPPRRHPALRLAADRRFVARSARGAAWSALRAVRRSGGSGCPAFAQIRSIETGGGWSDCRGRLDFASAGHPNPPGGSAAGGPRPPLACRATALVILRLTARGFRRARSCRSSGVEAVVRVERRRGLVVLVRGAGWGAICFGALVGALFCFGALFGWWAAARLVRRRLALW